MAETLKIKLFVTPAHIKRAQKLRKHPERENNCPVALALRGQLFREVSVASETVSLKKGGKSFMGDLNAKARKFILAFDTNQRELNPVFLTMVLKGKEA